MVWLYVIFGIILLITIPAIIVLYQAHNKPDTKQAVCNNVVVKPVQTQQTTQHEPVTTQPPSNQAKVLGETSQRERASDIISRIGYRGHQEPFGARYKFMETVLPQCKRSRHMIPIPEASES